VQRTITKHFAATARAKRYNIEPFLRIANLLPSEIRDGIRGVKMGTRFLPETDLPSLDTIRHFRDSKVGRAILSEHERLAIKKGDVDAKEALVDLFPSRGQERVFDAVRRKFVRRFPRGGIEFGARSQKFSDNPVAVYRLYAGVREVFSLIADARWKFGRAHLVEVRIPLPIVSMFATWNEGEEPATISFVPDVLFDGLRDALVGQDPQRLKRCPVCGAFFWAWRKDKGACSPRCLGLNRLRRHRAKSADYEYRRKLRSAGIEPTKPPKKEVR
jgi:hypothetical protein